MKLTHREQDGVVILEPKGKIMGGPDATVLHEQIHELISQSKLRVVIDLAKVDWMNSTGLGILIAGLTTLRDNKGDLKLACVTDKIQSLLTITKLITVFDAYDTVEEAIAGF
ncbi:MAG TPA: STAS domain-containing protein [candidate division Zixibacteria bacterium]|jgi:anti-sigma B factor antagonist